MRNLNDYSKGKRSKNFAGRGLGYKHYWIFSMRSLIIFLVSRNKTSNLRQKKFELSGRVCPEIQKSISVNVSVVFSQITLYRDALTSNVKILFSFNTVLAVNFFQQLSSGLLLPRRDCLRTKYLRFSISEIKKVLHFFVFT